MQVKHTKKCVENTEALGLFDDYKKKFRQNAEMRSDISSLRSQVEDMVKTLDWAKEQLEKAKADVRDDLKSQKY